MGWRHRPGGTGRVAGGPPAAPLPSELRQRVIVAIEDTEAERNLLAPPGVAEIAAALRAANADALAYLLPAQEDEDYPEGLVVLVGADERVRDIALPRLAAGPRSRVDTFAAAQREWQQAEQAQDAKAKKPPCAGGGAPSPTSATGRGPRPWTRC